MLALHRFKILGGLTYEAVPITSIFFLGVKIFLFLSKSGFGYFKKRSGVLFHFSASGVIEKVLHWIFGSSGFLLIKFFQHII